MILVLRAERCLYGAQSLSTVPGACAISVTRLPSVSLPLGLSCCAHLPHFCLSCHDLSFGKKSWFVNHRELLVVFIAQAYDEAVTIVLTLLLVLPSCAAASQTAGPRHDAGHDVGDDVRHRVRGGARAIHCAKCGRRRTMSETHPSRTERTWFCKRCVSRDPGAFHRHRVGVFWESSGRWATGTVQVRVGDEEAVARPFLFGVLGIVWCRYRVCSWCVCVYVFVCIFSCFVYFLCLVLMSRIGIDNAPYHHAWDAEVNINIKIKIEVPETI